MSKKKYLSLSMAFSFRILSVMLGISYPLIARHLISMLLVYGNMKRFCMLIEINKILIKTNSNYTLLKNILPSFNFKVQSQQRKLTLDS